MRGIIPLLASGCAALLVVVWALRSEGARSREDAFFYADWGTSNPPTTLDLKQLAGDPDTLLLELAVEDPVRLATAERLSFLVATYGAKPQLVSATFFVPSLGLCFTADPRTELKDNHPLLLVPSKPCAEKDASTKPAVLEIKKSGPSRVTLWSVKASPKVRKPLLSGRSQPSGKIIPIGSLEGPPGPEASVYELLAATWGRTGSETAFGLIPLTWVLLGAGLFILLGAGTLVASGRMGREPYAALMLFASGIAVCYAVLVPPFQNPDEPDHILTLARFANDPRLAKDALELAQTGHFERLKFYMEHRFVSSDVGHPFGVPFMPAIIEMDLVERSIGQRSLWAFLGGIWTPGEVSGEILRFRLASSVFILGAFGLVLFLGFLCNVDPRAVFLATFHAPFLVFIGTTPGNYALVVAGSILAAGSVLLTLSNRSLPVALLSSCCAGLGAALGFVGNSAGLFTVVFFAAFLPFQLVSDAVHAARPKAFAQIAGLRLGGFAAGAALVLGLTRVFDDGLWLPPTVSRNLAQVVERQGAGMVLALVALVLGASAGAVYLFRRGREKALLTAVRVPLLLALAWTLIFPLIRPLRDVPSIEAPAIRPEALEYVRLVLRGFFTSLMPTGSIDRMVGETFWSGFGWLDVALPRWQVGWQRFWAGGLLAWAIVRPGWAKRGTDTLVWFGALTATMVCIGATTYGYWIRSYNMHGRYFVVCYALFLATLFGLLETDRRPAAKTILTTLACGAVLLHAAVLSSLLFRYFS